MQATEESVEREPAEAREETAAVAGAAPPEPEGSGMSLRSRTAYLLAAAVLVGLSLWWTQFSTQAICCGDFDGYYHYRWSKMLEEGMRTGNFPPRFESLPRTTLNADDYVDHHFLFHVLQIPFTWFTDARRAALAVLLVTLLLSPLVYRRAARLAAEGNRRFVSGVTGAFAAVVVFAGLFGPGAGVKGVAVAASAGLGVGAVCFWLLASMLARGQTRPVAAFSALAASLAPAMGLFRATTFYQERAADLFASDPYANFQYGAKLGVWLFACAAVLSCFWLVVRHQLRYPFIWLLALLSCSGPFFYRMNMGKAMSVSIVLLIVGIHLLFRRKYLWLFPLAYVFALTYDMVLLLWVAAGIWAAVNVWGEDWDVTSPAVLRAWGGLLLVVAGTALGFVLNPYFPRNVTLMYEHMLMKITPNDFSTAVGGEWYPYSTWEFLGGSFVACASMVVGYVAARGPDRRERVRALFFLFFATLLMIVNARWKRFAEYWPPFAVLFAAFALQCHLARRPRAEGAGEPWRYARWLEYGLASLAGLLLGAGAVSAAYVMGREIGGNEGPRAYLGGMQWVKENVPEGEMIFNTDWDDFPKLFFYSPEHRYAAGLDPTYLLDRDRELSELYGRIGVGDERDPAPPIRQRFGARYVFTDNEPVHDDFYNAAMDSGWFEEVYTDDKCTVLRIRDRKGEPAGGGDTDDER